VEIFIALLAEFARLGLRHFAKGRPPRARWQRQQHWERHTSGVLAGTTAVVVGLGGIGREVCRLLAAAGLIVSGCGRPGHRYDVPGVSSYTYTARLHEVLPDAGALVLACPLTDQTRGLITARELAALPAGAVVVNLSRGAVIDEPALVSALTSGHLGGACLDVFAVEPLPLSSPLWAIDNVIVSPHSASTVAAENRLLVELFIGNLQRWLAGEPLRNVYDRVAGY
jgi:glyoxylate/hydroxypyruvate reductase